MAVADNGNERDLLRKLKALEKRIDHLTRATNKSNSSISQGSMRIYATDSATTERILLSPTSGLTVRDATGQVPMIQQAASDGALMYPFQPAGEWAVADAGQWFTGNPDRLGESVWNTNGRLGSLKFHRFAPKFNTVIQFWNTTGIPFEVRLDCDHNTNSSSILSIPGTTPSGIPYTLFELDIEAGSTLYEPIRVNLSVKRQTGTGIPASGALYWEPSGVFQGGPNTLGSTEW